jgi:hypothetical protein
LNQKRKEKKKGKKEGKKEKFTRTSIIPSQTISRQGYLALRDDDRKRLHGYTAS